MLEAAAHGTASVAFDVKAGPRDILGADGERGLLLPDVSPLDQLTEALTKLTKDTSTRHDLAAKALAVREMFDLDRILDQWETTLLDAVSKP